jgi:hypothetical protein
MGLTYLCTTKLYTPLARIAPCDTTLDHARARAQAPPLLLPWPSALLLCLAQRIFSSMFSLMPHATVFLVTLLNRLIFSLSRDSESRLASRPVLLQ